MKKDQVLKKSIFSGKKRKKYKSSDLGSFDLEDLEEEKDFDQDESYSENDDDLNLSEWKVQKKKSSSGSSSSSSSFISREDEYKKILEKEDSLAEFSRLVELEKEDLYDYVFRMTGRCDDTWRVLKETSAAMSSNYKKYSSYFDFKLALYSTARNFAADDWGSSTCRLENPGYDEYRSSGVSSKETKQLILVEREFLAIDKSWIKEALLLRYRYMFSPSEAASIMSSSINTVKSFEETGLKIISAKTKIAPENIKQMFPKFPEYNYVSNGSITTRALSQVMGSLKKDSSYRKGFWFTLLRIVVIALVGVGAYWLYLNYFKNN